MQELPQQAVDSEVYVTSCIFMNPDLIDECPLSSEDFLDVRNRTVYAAMEALNQKDQPINPVSVSNTIGIEKLKGIGGIDFVDSLANSAPTTAEFDYYCRMVKDRKVTKAGRSLMIKALSNMSRETMAETGETLIKLASEDRSKSKPLVETMGDLYLSLISNTDKLKGVTTGSIELDRMTGGLQDGNLIIVGARTSVGKSSFVVNMAREAAEKGVVVDFFTVEMSEETLLQRFISNMAELNVKEWLKSVHKLTKQELNIISGAMDHFMKLKINVIDNPSLTVQDVRARLRRSIKDYSDDKHLVIIDYLQYMNVLNHRPNRHDLEIGEITKTLKQIARKFGVPIVLLSQLSRAIEQRQDKHPMLSDLRDSGNIEQDADLILLLYRDKYYNRDAKDNDLEIIVAKQRNGPTGSVRMISEIEYQKFKNKSVG